MPSLPRLPTTSRSPVRPVPSVQGDTGVTDRKGAGARRCRRPLALDRVRAALGHRVSEGCSSAP